MDVIKSHGKRVPFDKEKVKISIRRSGASEEIVNRVADYAESKAYDGMTTKELYDIVFQELQGEQACFACRYGLRAAILKLGPAGFKFEKYVAAILRAYDYDAHVPDGEFKGSCVFHEIDGIAEKDGRRIMVEAKFRNRYNDRVNLKDTMATWSRFLDLVDGAANEETPKFDEAWLVTNAKFSDRALAFGQCKGMYMVSWNAPKKNSLAHMVDFRSMYPVTVLDKLRQSELEALSRESLLLCREVGKKEPEELERRLGVSDKRAQELVRMCTEVVEGGNTK